MINKPENYNNNLDMEEKNMMLKFLLDTINGTEYRNIRHYGKKHSRILNEFDMKLKNSSINSTMSTIFDMMTNDGKKISIEENISSSPLHNSIDTNNATDLTCYSPNQVLLIIGFTCLLNFAFVLLIVILTRCFGANGAKSKRYDKEILVNSDENYEQVDSYEEEEENSENEDNLDNWESARLRLASLPDNIITQSLTEKYMTSKLARQNYEFQDEQDEIYSASVNYYVHPCCGLKQTFSDGKYHPVKMERQQLQDEYYDNNEYDNDDENGGTFSRLKRYKRRNYSALPTTENNTELFQPISSSQRIQNH